MVMHEVLLSLCGYEGVVVLLPEEGARVNQVLVPEVVSIPEAKVIEELASIGVVVRKLDQLIKSSQSPCLVMTAYESSVKEVIDKHHANVCEMEQFILKDPHTPLSQIRFLLGEWPQVIQMVFEITDEIKRTGLFGGQILDYLYMKMVRCGSKRIRETLSRMLFFSNSVFFNMTEAWMAFGMLIDEYGEFFIQERDYSVYIPEDEETVLVYGEGHFHPLIAEYEWKSQFRLREEMLPYSYFRKEMAEKVLFVGKSVRVLQRESVSGDINKFVSMFVAAKSTFAMKEIERIIDEWYLFIAFEVQKLVVDRASLINHLNFVRDFYLLGRGEFFSSFISLGGDLMSTNPKTSLSQSEAAVNSGAWREAAIQCGLDDWDDFTSKCFSKLRVHLKRSKIHFGPGFKGCSGGVGGGSIINSFLDSSTTRTPSIHKGEKTPVSSLVMVGDAHLSDGIIEVMQPGGGLWFASKMAVDRGFESSIQVRQFRGDQPTWVSLVIHHDPMLGPTALGDIPNSISCTVEFSPDRDRVNLYAYNGSVVLFSGENEKLGAFPARKSVYIHNTIHVSYKSELTPSGAIKMMLEVAVMDCDGIKRAFISGDVNIQRVLKLERVAGHAWVGIVAKSELNKSNLRDFQQEARPCFLQVGSWNFSAPEVTDADAWLSLLDLKMRVSWPLHLLLTQHTLDQYGTIFRFLLGLKRVENALQESWAILNQTQFKKKCNPMQQKRLMKSWRQRASMAFLVNNLQFHLQVDVIDSLQKELVDNMLHAKDFRVVEEAHAKFVESLVSKSFLHNHVIRKALEDVLRQCMKFCHLVFRFHDKLMSDSEDIAGYDSAVEQISVDFHRVSMFLYTVLVRVNSTLLLRLDYNEQFSRHLKQPRK